LRSPMLVPGPSCSGSHQPRPAPNWNYLGVPILPYQFRIDPEWRRRQRDLPPAHALLKPDWCFFVTFCKDLVRRPRCAGVGIPVGIACLGSCDPLASDEGPSWIAEAQHSSRSSCIGCRARVEFPTQRSRCTCPLVRLGSAWRRRDEYHPAGVAIVV